MFMRVRILIYLINKNMWYAVDKSGLGYIFDAKPKRMKEQDSWECRTGGVTSSSESVFKDIKFPLMTWADEPVKFSIKIEIKK